MKKAIALALIAGASIATAAGQLVKLTGAAEFTVSPSQYGKQIKSIETRFFEQGYDKDARVFKVVTRSIYQTGLDGINDESVIEAYGTKASLYDTKIWSAKLKGGNFKVFNDDLISTTQQGCCDSPDLNRMINAKTGKVIVTAMNDSTVAFEVPNSKLEKRYLAQIQEDKVAEKKGTKQYMGSVGYFLAGKLTSVARIYASVPANWSADFYDFKPILKAKDQLDRNTVTVWSADGSQDAKTAFSGLGLSAHTEADTQTYTVSIMIDQDQLSASSSKSSPNVELEIVNL